MKARNNPNSSLADTVCDLRLKKVSMTFVDQVDKLIDWNKVRNTIEKKYTKRANAIGNPAYDCILLFKILLLQQWYNLSDPGVEERINDSLSFSRFLGLSIDEVSPDHSTISRFRKVLNKQGLMEPLLAEIDVQLDKYWVFVGKGVLVDASIVDTPNKPKGRPTFTIAGDREDDQPMRKNQRGHKISNWERDEKLSGHHK